MKVSFCVESILKRNHYIERVEEFLTHFRRAPVYTYAYAPGAVGGEIELMPIFSSYLSGMVKGDAHKLHRKTYLLPHIAPSFKIDCQTQLMMSFSSGFAHGMKKPKSAYHLCYLYDWNFYPSSIIGRLMAPATKRWMIKAFSSVDMLWVSREQVLEKVKPYYAGSFRLLPPDPREWLSLIQGFSFKH